MSPGFAERLSGFGDTVIDSCQKTSEGFDKACGKSYLSYTYIIFFFFVYFIICKYGRLKVEHPSLPTRFVLLLFTDDVIHSISVI